jgi:hypothetical protein
VKTSVAENFPEFSGLIVGSMRKLSDVTTLYKTHPLSLEGLSTDVTNATFYLA